MEKNKARKTISLNEEKRIKEKEELELQAMRIENARRKAKNLKTFANIEEFRSYEEEEKEEDEATSVAQRSLIDVDGDTVLIETGSILLDMITLSGAKQQQASAVKPK